MHTYKALYRKWRPQRFAEVVGQEYTARTLQNSIMMDEISHAYLFAGPRGIGKTTIARIFAKAINCLNPKGGEPCNECANCLRITKGNALDVIEIDGASNRGIDQIRQLREEVSFVPAETKYKVYIIDEVHMLTHEAFNALLKTLEEPPKRVIFIFATTEPHKVPPTVISRCQVFEFKNIGAEKIERFLGKVCQGEGIEASPAALRAIARRARGSIRDALVMLEQLAVYVGKRKIEEHDFLEVLGLPSEELISAFLKATLAKDGRKALAIIDELTQGGKDPELFLESLIEFCRDLIVTGIQGEKEALNKELDFSLPELIKLNNQLLELKREMRFSLDKRIMLEVGTLAITNANFEAKNKPQNWREASEKTKKDKNEKLEEKEAATSELDLGDTWARMLEAIKKEKRNAVYAFLIEGEPIIAEDLLRLEFDPQFKFHKEGLEKAENRRFLEKMIKEFYGDKKLEITLSSSTSTSSPQAKRQKKPKDELREKAELVKKTFDGEIVT